MHSSRMCTVHNSSHLCVGGGGWPGMTFCFGGLLIEGGLLLESGLLLWPSDVIFCYGLLVRSSFVLLWSSG